MQGLKEYKYETMKLKSKFCPFFLKDITCPTSDFKVKDEDRLLKIAQR